MSSTVASSTRVRKLGSDQRLAAHQEEWRIGRHHPVCVGRTIGDSVLFKNNPHVRRPIPLTRSAVADLCWWNLWQRPQPPFEALAVGDPVVLVDSWPTGSRLGWEVVVSDVEHARYATKAEALRTRAISLARVETDPYTAAKADVPGVLIAWRASAVRHLDRPRPAGLRFRQNGWLSEDDPRILRSWGMLDEDPGDDPASNVRLPTRSTIGSMLAIRDRRRSAHLAPSHRGGFLRLHRGCAQPLAACFLTQ